MIRRPRRSPLFPYTTLFRSRTEATAHASTLLPALPAQAARKSPPTKLRCWFFRAASPFHPHNGADTAFASNPGLPRRSSRRGSLFASGCYRASTNILRNGSLLQRVAQLYLRPLGNSLHPLDQSQALLIPCDLRPQRLLTRKQTLHKRETLPLILRQ